MTRDELAAIIGQRIRTFDPGIRDLDRIMAQYGEPGAKPESEWGWSTGVVTGVGEAMAEVHHDDTDSTAPVPFGLCFPVDALAAQEETT